MLFPTLFRDYSQITQSEDRDPFLKKNYEVFWGSYLEDNCFCGKSNKMRRRRLSLCQPQQCINSLKESTLFLCTELGWKFSQLCGELCREIDPANKIKYFFLNPAQFISPGQSLLQLHVAASTRTATVYSYTVSGKLLVNCNKGTPISFGSDFAKKSKLI